MLFIIIFVIIQINSSIFQLPKYSTASANTVSDFFKNKEKSKPSDISSLHNTLTSAAPLKYGILYNDSFNTPSINYYYLKKPSLKNTLYIKCLSGNISSCDIQIFDDTNQELHTNFYNNSSFICIKMKNLISKTSNHSRIYITIGSPQKLKLQLCFSNTYNTPKRKTKTNKSVKNKNKTNIKKDNKHTTIPKKNTSKTTHKKEKNNNKISPSNKKITHHNSHKNKTTTNINNKTNIKKSNATRPKNKKANIKTNKKNKSLKTTGTRNKNISHKNKINLFFISLSHKFVSLKSRECIKLKYHIKPTSLKNITTLWSSNNNSIASVSNGKITAHHPGIAIIKLTVKHNGIIKSTYCTIRVK